MQKTSAFMKLFACVLSSGNIWMCGITELPTPSPSSPPATATPTVPTAPSPTPAPTTTPPTTPTTTPPTTPFPTTTPEVPEPDEREFPADVLDLSNWYLTLPTGAKGDPDIVTQPELAAYRSDWFRLNAPGDGVVFRATVAGATTKNTKYPRSELREMTGTRNASWSNRSGTHTLTVRQAVTALPVAKPEIVTAQIHDSSDDVLQVRLEGKRLMVQYDDGNAEIVIDRDYELGTVFEVRIVAAQRRVQVFYNGVPAAEINRSGTGWYFKCGAYVQSNTSKGDRPTAAGEVVVHQLDVSHSD